MENDRELGSAVEPEMGDVGGEDGGRRRCGSRISGACDERNAEGQVALSDDGQRAVRRQAIFERFQTQRRAAAHARTAGSRIFSPDREHSAPCGSAHGARPYAFPPCEARAEEAVVRSSTFCSEKLRKRTNAG